MLQMCGVVLAMDWLTPYDHVSKRVEKPVWVLPENWIISVLSVITVGTKQFLWCGTPTDNCCIAVLDLGNLALRDTIQLDRYHFSLRRLQYPVNTQFRLSNNVEDGYG